MKKREFIAQDLLSKIYQHRDTPLEKLPPERKLAEEYGVSRFTLRKALEKLVAIGAVRIVQGAGIFINPGVGNNPLIYNSITEKKFNQIRYRLLELHKRRPDSDERQIFGLTDSDFIWAFTRLRKVEGVTVQLEYARMPAAGFADLTPHTIEHSIQQYLLSKGCALSHSLTHYRATTVSKTQAALLGCKKGIAAMHILNRGILPDGRVAIFSDIIDIDYACSYVIPFNRDNLAFRQS
ncbi:GntR family transcriptional regulator [Chimaeribacter coloradensis]|uniref:GntR family transcriptional regulator n=1 Tax=Chimaeribacter coloradensis TaxID=2060068 RepID=A0A2N5E3C8_9GAMM|nr:GntR family transcriptional regulator [Chimaeribacter coloradensis]PLR35216.1 GntR family transcriptional regulator [Chimaeribacter coloradensis]